MPQLELSSYPSQLFWLCVCFFSLYFIMAQLILPKIADIIEQRQRKIDDYIDKAADMQKKAEKSLAKYQDALAKATAEADKSLQHTQDELNELIAQKQAELDTALKAKITESEAEIRLSKEQALKEVSRISENIALDIVNKLGLKDITAADIKTAIKKTGEH